MKSARDVPSMFGPRADGYDEEAFDAGEGLRFISALELHAIRDGLGPVDGRRVLDVGAGTGRIARMLSDLGASVTAMDVTPEMIERCGRHAPEARRVLADAGDALPFGDERFGAITCIRVLKYVDDWRRALTELSRTLCDGGRLVVEVTNRRSLARWGYASIPVQTRTLAEVRELAAGCGLTVESVRPGVRLPFALYRWAGSASRLHRLRRLERAIRSVIGPNVLARSLIVSCRKEPRPRVRSGR